MSKVNAFIPSIVTNQWNLLPLYLQNLVVITTQILAVTICVILVVAFTTFFERKVIGYMQGRIGPNRVGIKGLGQPFADVIKLLILMQTVPDKDQFPHE